MNRNIEDYIRPGARAHLVGVGGVSMAPLAEVLKGKGVEVTGSDMQESRTVDHLRTLGIPVTIGHRPESVAQAGCVIRTAAVHDDNLEIAAARSAGIPVFERAQAWGAIMRHYPNALCVAGTHGKTTTTSMCTHIFLAAGRDPSVMIGGTLPILGAGHRVGHGDTIIAESCEYCNSFLSFAPTVAVILNVEADHLDFFQDLKDIENSFRKFAELVPAPGGHVVANWDNANVRETLEGFQKSCFTFSLTDRVAHCWADNLTWDRGLPSFDVIAMGEKYAHVSLRVGGIHNVSNALAAASADSTESTHTSNVYLFILFPPGKPAQLPPLMRLSRNIRPLHAGFYVPLYENDMSEKHIVIIIVCHIIPFRLHGKLADADPLCKAFLRDGLRIFL